MKVNPTIKDFGGVYNIPTATIRADDTEYRIVVDVASGPEHPDSLGQGLYRVSRMMNLFPLAGVSKEKLEVVLAVHATATHGMLSDTAYRKRYGVSNPNTELIKQLHEAGVRITVCGQSLIGRGVDMEELLPEVEVAVSMLTTVATYQSRGYMFMRF